MTDNLVYGLAGIMQLFNCSKTTAQRLKNGILAPACYQVGRKIVVDREQALCLVKADKQRGNKE